MKESAVHPIIYVRGYAMTQAEIEDTVADPYMGFNIGRVGFVISRTGATSSFRTPSSESQSGELMEGLLSSPSSWSFGFSHSTSVF